MFDFNYKINNDIFNDLYQLNRYFTKKPPFHVGKKV